jgi:hypothetical protein
VGDTVKETIEEQTVALQDIADALEELHDIKVILAEMLKGMKEDRQMRRLGQH